MWWTGSLVVVLAAGLSACAGLPGVQPSVESVEPRIEALDLEGLDAAFDVHVSNPMLSALHVPHFTWDLDVQGRTLASGRRGLRADFPAAGVGTVTIPVRVTYGELAAIYGDLAGRTEAEYRLAGLFKVPVLGSTVDLPFEHSGTFPIVRPPSVVVERIDTTAMSPLGGEIHVDARITNPNGFPLELGGLGYALGLGDDAVAVLRTAAAPALAPGASESLRLTGRVSLASAVSGLLSGGVSRAHLSATGAVGTPYGTLRLP